VSIVDDLQVLRKRWRLIAIFLIVGIGAAIAYVATATPKYEASTQLFVAVSDTDGSSSGLQSSDEFSQDRVKSYSDLIQSSKVTTPVAAEFGDGLTAKQLSKEISADAPPNTVLLDVHVTDTNAARARTLADAVSKTFLTDATGLEAKGSNSKVPPVKITLFTTAALPTSPVSPRKTLDIVLGLIIGLVLGVGAAILRETLDTTVKDPTLISDELELASLGVIARKADAGKRPLLAQADRSSGWSEQFHKVCTNLQYVEIDDPPSSIVVTSAVPGEGKSVTVTNLAIALAESGRQVVLVEADLRRPKVSDYLGLERAVGLTTVLVGYGTLDEALQSWGTTGNLQVLSSGAIPPNPNELLRSNGMAELLKELEDRCDLVLIDSPPVLAVADAAVLANLASGAVVVAKYGKTRSDQLAQAVEELRGVGATLYGSIVTMTPAKSSGSYAAYAADYSSHSD
jgi:polysaccharide biosynthesis transport protein